MQDNYGEILIYQSSDGLTNIEVRVQNETVWLTQQQMAELFQTSRTNVVEHIKNIYEEDELDENSTCQKFRQVRKEGNRELLVGSGHVSHKQALDKAKNEYRKYQEITIAPVEQSYLESMKEVSKKAKKSQQQSKT